MSHRIPTLGLTALALLLPAVLPAAAQPECDPELLLARGGQMHESVLSGSHLLVAMREGGLLSVDVSDLAAPIVLDQLPPHNPPRTQVQSVDRVGDIACYTESSSNVNGRNQFVVFADVSDPGAIRLLGAVEITGRAADVSYDGRHAYVSAGGDGVYVVDGQDPSAPEIIAHIPLTGYSGDPAALSVVEDGGLLFFSIGDNFSDDKVLYDVSDPAHPQRLSTFSDPPGRAYGAALRGGVLYMFTRPFGQLFVIDVSDPTNPRPLTATSTGRGAVDLWLDGDRLYAADDSGITIFDVSEPASLQQIGAMAIEDTNCCAAAEGIVHVCSYLGLVSLDATDAGSIEEIGRLELVPHGQSVRLFGSLGVSSAGEVWLFDTSDMRSGGLLGRLQLPDYSRATDVDGEFAYTASGETLTVLDISDPANPAVLTAHPTPGESHDVRTRGGVTYVSGEFGLITLDTSDPSHPVITDAEELGGDLGLRIFREGERLYVSTTQSRLHVLDLSDPAHPAPLATLALPGNQVLGMDFDDGLTYMSVASDGLYIFDLADLQSPVQLGQFDTSFFARELHVADGVATIAWSETGVVIVDVSDPAHPVEITRQPVSDGAWTLSPMAPGYALVGAGEAGLYLMRTACCPADFNGDGALSTQDVLAFLNAFTSDDWRADFNADNKTDTRDVLAFLAAWAAGCQ